MIGRNQLAGIQYAGLPGVSEACVQAIQRMVQYDDHIVSAKLLTSSHDHGLLLIVGEYDKVAVKSGFASGYKGEGPSALARVLQLLLDHGVDIQEVEIERAVLDRLDASGLTTQDLEAIDACEPVRPTRIYDYIYDANRSSNALGMCWDGFPAVLPFAIIDKRIADLALRFHEEPNDTLLQGFRRLEDLVRRRIESQEHGAKLFSQAFQGEGAKLTWKEVQPSEIVGRANLFTGTYMAHRNPRAHCEMRENMSDLLSEFLLLNHLFRLEANAVPNLGAKLGTGSGAYPRPSLVAEIQNYVAAHGGERPESERQRLLKQRQRSRTARETIADLKKQRDAATGLNVEANARIVILTRKLSDAEARINDLLPKAGTIQLSESKPKSSPRGVDINEPK